MLIAYCSSPYRGYPPLATIEQSRANRTGEIVINIYVVYKRRSSLIHLHAVHVFTAI